MDEHTSNSPSRMAPEAGELARVPDMAEAVDYRLLVEHSRDTIWFIDLALQCRYVNPSVEDLLGYTADEYRRMNILKSITAESATRITQMLAEKLALAEHDVRTLEQTYTFEVNFIHRDGFIVPTEVRASFLRNETGAPAGIIGVTRDLRDRRRVETALNQSEWRHRQVAELTSDWIWEVDRKGVFTYMNTITRQSLGFDSENTHRKRVVDFVPPSDAAKVRTFFRDLVRHPRAFTDHELAAQSKDGSLITMEVSGTPIYDAEGKWAGYLGCNRDITDRKRAERELRDYSSLLESTNKSLETYYAAAQAATKAKSEFLANMSHEIRTPMTAILGFTDLLLDSLQKHEDIEAAKTIKRNGLYLLNLINDILDLSKIEAGRMVMEKTAFSPITLVNDVMSLMRPRANVKNLQIDAKCVGPIPETIKSDPLRLRQILINLVGNAVKFTNTGSVRVVQRLVESGNRRAVLRLDVIDTGIGITKGQIDRLFLPFVQGDASTSRTFGGSGLGLAISKRLAEMLDGDITVTSEPDHGSVFSLTVDAGNLADTRMIDYPSEAAVPAAPHDAVIGADAPAIKLHCRVLLAEDGADNRRLISILLKSAGAEITTADNGQAAVDLALAAKRDARPFDIILMDMQMPVMDGYQATERLRLEGIAAPIIAITANAMHGDREACVAAGCNDYISKPIDRMTLLNMLARHAPQPNATPQAIAARLSATP